MKPKIAPSMTNGALTNQLEAPTIRMELISSLEESMANLKV